MSDYITDGQNICVFPEGTWNLTPSKPMLPLYWGIIDIARTTGRPIIPVVLEYRAFDCYVKWGAPIYVSSKDNKQSKIDELSDEMAALRWEIWGKEAFERLEQLRRKGTVVDYDAELTSYREEKYGK